MTCGQGKKRHRYIPTQWECAIMPIKYTRGRPHFFCIDCGKERKLSKKDFERVFLERYGFDLVDYNICQVERIIKDYGSSEEKKKYKEYLK